MINNILYGKKNEVYEVESIENNVINVIYRSRFIISFNDGSETKYEDKEELRVFNANDIGIKIFFKMNDGEKTAEELLEDFDYDSYKQNLYKRLDTEKKQEKEEYEEIIKKAPEVKMTLKEKDLKLLEYEDYNKSMKEEEAFYNRVNESYFARMDIDTLFYKDHYYERFYISKDTEENEFESSEMIDGIYYTPDELKEKFPFYKPTKIKKEKGININYGNGINLIHWTAPIASLYYDSNNKILNRGKYKYEAMLKRTFTFNPLRYVNTYIQKNSFYKDGVIDEFLMKCLMDKKNSDELTDIIYSIQSNQNKIIRTDNDESFIVQGCAGCGKTMILLHRLSYLKFNNQLPQYDKIKIISPNIIFKEYIYNLTNTLDINEIENTTISNYYLYLNNLYFKKYANIQGAKEKEIFSNKIKAYKTIFDENNMIDENQFSHLILNKIYSDNTFKLIKEEYDKKIKEIKNKIEKTKLMNIVDNILYNNNAMYFDRAIYLINNKIKKYEQQINSMYIILNNLYRDQQALVFSKSPISTNNNIENEIQEQQNKIKTIKNKKAFIEEIKNDILENGFYTIDYYLTIINKINKLLNIDISFEKYSKYELLIFLYINYLHFGELIDGDKLLCFDEAQDYNYLEYDIIKKVNKNVVMNLYGDLNQSFYSKGLHTWDRLINDFKLNYYSLNENYRNTINITEFCNNKFNYKITPMGLSGKAVKFIDKNDIDNIIKQKIQEKRKIAIICNDIITINKLKNKIQNQYVSYNTVEMSKGIEYDTVIVFDNNMNNNQKYISYTRALNELYIINT